jgi:hypothetical protein
LQRHCHSWHDIVIRFRKAIQRILRSLLRCWIVHEGFCCPLTHRDGVLSISGHPRGEEEHTAYGNLVSRYYYGPHSLMNTKMHMSFLHLFFLTYIILDLLFLPDCLCPKEQDRRCYTLCGSEFTGRIISDWSARSFRFFFCLLNFDNLILHNSLQISECRSPCFDQGLKMQGLGSLCITLADFYCFSLTKLFWQPDVSVAGDNAFVWLYCRAIPQCHCPEIKEQPIWSIVQCNHPLCYFG